MCAQSRGILRDFVGSRGKTKWWTVRKVIVNFDRKLNYISSVICLVLMEICILLDNFVI